ncbi:ATP-binding protein [Caballeronia humi]|uniref:histidine kinase n=1 Tax=Caballeronia humi TaxID=326474 RepID=A0A158HRR0_9BURK|nr:ATP-binding protein [Caballeronia humi]SAL47065.1 integral membrane sensor signal transduction histidine kinase [Caballeronia humi]
MRSLRFRLSAWLSLLIAGIAAVAGVIAFETAFREANELQDGQLAQVSALVTPRSLAAMEHEALASVPGTDHEAKLIVQTLATRAPLTLPAALPDGIQTVNVAGTPWRIVVKTLDADTRVVVGQQTAGRDEIARNSALATIMPFVMLVPVLIFMLGFLVRRMFMPLTALSSSLDHRTEHDLSELPDAGLPSEIVPFVVAINRLLGRIGQTVALQRRFVADAAHELRSPLTALSLQAERLEATEMPPQARERLAALKRGLTRARVLIEQLLTLARVQDQASGPTHTLSIQHVFRHVLEESMPLAEAKRIDMGVTSKDDVTVRVPEVDLRILLRNLVDNAIRYTPEGGRIDLSVCAVDDQAVVRIVDSGPGIAREERERVFDPFYRVIGNVQNGSGLGLSIVRSIAARIGAEVELGDAAPHGLQVTVTLAGISH